MDQHEYEKGGNDMRLINKIFRLLGYSVETLKYFILYPIAMLRYRNRHIHIFAERGNDARDNGYHMYRFYRENHPELESYYVISKDSPDRYKVSDLGNVVSYGSLKHYLLFIVAEYKISTHIMGFSPHINYYSRFADKLHIKGYRIFLQHGVTSSDLPGLYSQNTNLDIFICGAKPEFDFISDTFGYHNGEVKYTGLARYDGLHDINLKKQILCMPTWRKYLKYDPAVKIEESEYVRIWNSLLSNPKLISSLRENNMQLVFYPHYEMQEHISLFKSDCDEVVIARFKDYDVQQLLKESQLLITDYSSIFYDFAYMEKPMIYFHFDNERYFNEHYAKGYFDYESMGFGAVLFDEKEVVEKIIMYLKTNFEIEAEYKKRINNFFPLHDKQNCQRIYTEIEKCC